MTLLNIILLAFNMVLVPVALLLGWIRGYDDADRVNTELWESHERLCDARDELEKAYARLGKSIYENYIKEDDHE